MYWLWWWKRKRKMEIQEKPNLSSLKSWWSIEGGETCFRNDETFTNFIERSTQQSEERKNKERSDLKFKPKVQKSKWGHKRAKEQIMFQSPHRLQEAYGRKKILKHSKPKELSPIVTIHHKIEVTYVLYKVINTFCHQKKAIGAFS